MRKHGGGGLYARHHPAGVQLPSILASPSPPPFSPRTAAAHGHHRPWWSPSALLRSAAGALPLVALAWACLLAGFLAARVLDGAGGGGAGGLLGWSSASASSSAARLLSEAAAYGGDAPVLVSYSYYEKDPVQVANFEFFLAAGTTYPARHSDVHWAFVVSGDNCSPCQGLRDVLKDKEPADLSAYGIKEAWSDRKFTLVYRTENVGMDLGAHNATLELFSYRRRLGKYSYFIFLNSSVKGPYLPPWVPPGWHWTHPFLERFRDPGVRAVGSSLVCLPDSDAGGPGPRLESWAFALDGEGLAVALGAGVFVTRGCKLCEGGDEGIVVGGEYGLTRSQLDAGHNVAALMSRYARGVDWRDRAHWRCNDNVHPSRQGTYGGISQHPFETVFVKSSWHVADPYTRRYSHWALQHLLGRAGTDGSFDERLYRYGVSLAAQSPKDLEAAYRPDLPPK